LYAGLLKKCQAEKRRPHVAELFEVYLRLLPHGNSGRGPKSTQWHADDFNTVNSKLRAQLLCWIDGILREAPHLEAGTGWNRKSLAVTETLQLWGVHQSLDARYRRERSMK
jgi:hypothetical protein